MRRGWQSFVGAAGFLALAAVAALLHGRLEATAGRQERLRELLFIPETPLLRLMALGEENSAADLLWLRCVFYMAAFHEGHDHSGHGNLEWLQDPEHTAEPEYADHNGESAFFSDRDFSSIPKLRQILQIGVESGYAPQLLRVLNAVTDLDPRFISPYYIGAMNLGVVGGRYEESLALIDKGLNNNPDSWEMPYYRGFVKLFFMNDKEGAAEDILTAARTRGAPVIVVQLAAAFQVGLGHVDAALTFLENLRQLTDDPVLREKVENMLTVYRARQSQNDRLSSRRVSAALDSVLTVIGEERR